MIIAIRSAVLDEVDAIRRCVDAAYRHYIPRLGKPPGPMLVDYAALVAEKRVWVATANAAVLGVLVPIPGDGYLLLDNIAVHPDAQGKGIASRLLNFADQEANRRNYSELHLYTHVKMTENIELYRHLGWQESGRGQQDGYERVFFHRPVPPS